MSNKLEIGKTYKSKNGNAWECIFVRDRKAWLVGAYGGVVAGSAYEFDIDGTASWVMEHDRDPYNIVFEPVRTSYYEEVYINGGGRGRLCYETVDGVFDPKSIRVEFDVAT